MKCLFFLLFIVLCFNSCDKETARVDEASFYGTWELRTSDGGLLGAHNVFPAGNGNTITFFDNNQYMKTTSSGIRKDTVSNTYHIIKGSNCLSNDITFIQLLPDSSYYLLSLSNDTLHVDANTCIMADVADLEYKKIK